MNEIPCQVCFTPVSPEEEVKHPTVQGLLLELHRICLITEALVLLAGQPGTRHLRVV
ncbi:hypothetical protein [Saccharothrix sp. ST-888]|uniref:hypothetical protein n=1 Tax=Saccharothrix sp. ST-888 TaxID=1427391 RepID=UPI000A618DB0|nr:hypothetical protein [Saccharothrix sp. ST-888]